jgi:site-specific DNA-methyltransferase (cytosine-N4-specific)
VRAGTVRLLLGDARGLPAIPDASVQLVVTSPPYPMLPLWDDVFASMGARTFSEMHAALADAWRECRRVLVDGGLLCVNVGDALRSDRSGFRLWPNHAAVLDACDRLGFVALPYVLWKKPTNKPNAFLGSGFLPPNAYVTLDCEFILLFRKGATPRRFPRLDARRRGSRYSRGERDRWFSQIWTDVRGAPQERDGRRLAAFPEEIPARLVRMFSVVGDTVLDPFAGTGTTLWVASRLGRHAIGVERDPARYAELVRRRDAEGEPRSRRTRRAPSSRRRGTGGARSPPRRSA